MTQMATRVEAGSMVCPEDGIPEVRPGEPEVAILTGLPPEGYETTSDLDDSAGDMYDPLAAEPTPAQLAGYFVRADLKDAADKPIDTSSSVAEIIDKLPKEIFREVELLGLKGLGRGALRFVAEEVSRLPDSELVATVKEGMIGVDYRQGDELKVQSIYYAGEGLTGGIWVSVDNVHTRLMAGPQVEAVAASEGIDSEGVLRQYLGRILAGRLCLTDLQMGAKMQYRPTSTQESAANNTSVGSGSGTMPLHQRVPIEIVESHLL